MRITSIVCAILSTSIVCTAQTPIGSTVFGLRAGFTMASLHGSDVRDSLSPAGAPASLPGWHAGITATSTLDSTWLIMHDLTVVQQGSYLTTTDETGRSYQGRLRLLYLMIAPLDIGIRYHGIRLHAGPYASMLIDASIQRMKDGHLVEDDALYGDASSMQGYAHKLDAGIGAGIDYDTDLGLSVGLRWNYGLTPLIENALVQHGQASIHTMSWSVTCAYLFR